MRKLFSLMLAVMMVFAAIPLCVSAKGVTEDGLNYTIYEKNGTVTITGYEGSAAEVTIPSSIEGYPVVAIGSNAFAYCRELQYINIPDSVVSIGTSAFFRSGLVEITIPESVCEISGYTFQDCKSLEKINLHDGITKIGNVAFESCEKLTSIELPSKLEEISSQMFRLSGIESIVIPEGVKTVEKNAFADCYYLESVVIPKSVTNIYDWAFSACRSLKEVEIPENCKIGYASFRYCESLENVWISGDNTTLASESFSNCRSLKNVYISEGVEYIDLDVFKKSDNISYIELPRSIITLGESITTPRENLETVVYHGTEKQWNLLIGKYKTDLSEKVQILGIYGDFDGDKEITVNDALYMRKFLAKVTSGEFVNIYTGDMNDDGKVNLKDQLIIRKMLAE